MSDLIEIFKSENIKLSVSKFGHLTAPECPECIYVQKYTWETSNRLTLEVLTLDAAIIGLQAPDRDRNPTEVLLVCGNLPQYLHYDEHNLTSSVQSVALRRKNATWLQRIWSPFVNGSDLILTNVLLDECRNLMVRVRFSVSSNNIIRINYHVVSDRMQPLETAHRMVMNLGGSTGGYLSTYEHVVQVNGNGFYKTRKNRIEDRIIKEMTKDLADLRVAQHIGMAIYRSEEHGFDALYKLSERQGMHFDSRIIHARTGRVVEVYSDFGWLRFSTLDDLPDPGNSIVPFYASLGVKRIDQIFNLDGFVRSVVHLVEGSDEEISQSSLVSSLRSSTTMNDSVVQALIDDLLLQKLEERIRALKDEGILSVAEARGIIEHLLLMSLDKTDEFIKDAAKQCAQALIEDLVVEAVSTSCSIDLDSNQEDTLDGEVFSGADSQSMSTETNLETIEEEQIFPEFLKHSGILLQMVRSPVFKKCKPKGVFSIPSQVREQELVFNHSVLLKFGICKSPPVVNKAES